ncbi:MAG TPA: SurA N-terminal domain-containing protein, partial [Kofleriaceae bacterium]
MLEQQRRQGASAVIYVLFSILIAAMVYSLAPSSRQGRGEGGCSSSANVPVVVDGQDTSQTAYMVAFGANGASGRQKTYVALDWMVRRELLAQAADQHGIKVNDDTVDEAIKHGWFFLGGNRMDASS